MLSIYSLSHVDHLFIVLHTLIIKLFCYIHRSLICFLLHILIINVLSIDMFRYIRWPSICFVTCWSLIGFVTTCWSSICFVIHTLIIDLFCNMPSHVLHGEIVTKEHILYIYPLGSIGVTQSYTYHRHLSLNLYIIYLCFNSMFIWLQSLCFLSVIIMFLQ